MLGIHRGPPSWGGGKKIMREEVYPIMKRQGIESSSGKRRELFGNPSSDHFFLNLLAFAKDWKTVNNQVLAQTVRSKLIGNDSPHVDYENFYFYRWGRKFRGQIIAGTHGTGPHLHVGIKRES